MDAGSRPPGDSDGDRSEEDDPEEEHRDLFERIASECRHNAPAQSFSGDVRAEIERLAPAERERLVARTRAGAAPLFAASARGALACARYLLRACGAPLEQRGAFRAPGAAEAHLATPLWAAAVAGRLDVLRELADAGADVDAASDSGSTPLRAACSASRAEVARFLLARGADVRRRDHGGGSCLASAVRSPELCRLLLAAGADVDAADARLETALHRAVRERREDTARLLLAAGADPRRETRDGDDALRLACLRGAAPLVRALLAAGGCGAARAADAHELLGASQLDELGDAAAARASWRTATDIRRAGAGAPIPKRPLRAPAAALDSAREWSTREELEAHAHDADWMRTQALLVALRVLGPTHRDTLLRLAHRGAAFADTFRFSRCVALWTWALELRIRRDTLLHPETCRTLGALTRLLLEVRAAGGAVDGAALALLRRLAAEDALPRAQGLLRARPACRAQGAAFDRALRCALRLLLAAGGGGGALGAARALVALRLRSHAAGDSPLHLACGAAFPSRGVARLLLAAGAAPDALNAARCTALHAAALPAGLSSRLVEALLAAGAHLDRPNRFGESAAELVQLSARSRVRPLRHVSLACRAARALAPLPPAALAALPASLRPFVLLHRP